MANYAVTGTQTTGTGYKTILSIVSSATLRRVKWYDVLFGTTGTPADNAMQFDISRITAAGTNTAVTAQALDPADQASLVTTCGNLHTVEPTVTANSSVINIGINQRASYRWVAAPGSELVSPATSAAGFALRALSPAYTGVTTGNILFQEQ